MIGFQYMKTKVKNSEHIQIAKISGIKHVILGKLILLPCKFIESVFALTRFNDLKLSKDINGTSVKCWLKPIIISETEHKDLGYLYSCYNIKEKKFGHYGGELYEFNRFILALSDNFSQKNLQDIIDGKLKDKDEVYIECEIINEENYIKLDTKNHITMYNVETPMYTEKQLLDTIEWLNKNTYFNGSMGLQRYGGHEHSSKALLNYIQKETNILK